MITNTRLKYAALFTVLSFSLSAGLSANNPITAQALAIDAPCDQVEVIFARGSGQEYGKENLESDLFFRKIRDRISSIALSPHTYELGGESYGGYKYPAVDVGGRSFMNAIGASLSSGYYFTYGDSVKQGVGELKSYLDKRHAKCKADKTLYILGGYSQGAQVIGQTLSKLSAETRNDIVFVGLFGDPKLHYPEGEGLIPPACRGKDLSPWRRAASNCFLDNGWLVSRKPYLPDDMKQKTGLWCYMWDMMCDPGYFPHMSGHGEYKKEGRAFDEAAREAIEKLKYRLEKDYVPPLSIPGQPVPPPPIDYNRALDVRHVAKEGTTGENTVFVVDVSETMAREIPAIERFLRDAIPKIISSGGKVSVVVYIGVKDRDGNIVDNLGAGSPFGVSAQELLDALPIMLYPNGGYPPGSSLLTLDVVLSALDWDNGATKSITLLSNNPLVDPDFVGLTVDAIAKKALAIDPVNIYPVVPETSRQAYTELAAKTSGQVVTYTNADNVLQAANQAYDKIHKRPVPLLKNTEYRAEPGQEITFDASDSYVLDASITKYEWDYNGDGQFEATTTTPSANHTYASPFTGHMQVRVSASNGTIANMSAKVTVATITPPVLPAPPKNLAYTVTSTTDNKSTVTINWQTTPGAEAWLVRINDMPMGYVEAGRTSLEITDIERTGAVTIGIAGGAGTTTSLNTGEFATVTIPAITPPPVTSACSQTDIFMQSICEATALFRTSIEGFRHYISQ